MILEVTGLHCHYGPVHAVKGMDFAVGMGEAVALIGANGAGKTTTLRAIVGTLRPSSGSVRLDGTDLVKVPAHARIGRGMAYVPEGRQILATFTVEENLMLGAFYRMGKEPAAAIRQTLAEVYDLFPMIARLRTRFAGFTSGGEQQVIAIGRALMAKPRLLLLDEPSMGLSPILTQFVAESLMKLRATGIAMVLVEQNVDLALKLADRAIVMETGHPALQGTTAELRQNDDIRRIYLGQSTAAARTDPEVSDAALADPERATDPSTAEASARL
jgi:branched-chain amino acid transport system ATP-binding protein